MSPDFAFPAQPASADLPPQEFAIPPVARETEFEVPPVSATTNQAGFEVPEARAAMPAYHRGPSYASEVDNLAEPQVLREDTILVSQRPLHLESQILLHINHLQVTSACHGYCPAYLYQYDDASYQILRL